MIDNPIEKKSDKVDEKKPMSSSGCIGILLLIALLYFIFKGKNSESENYSSSSDYSSSPSKIDYSTMSKEDKAILKAKAAEQAAKRDDSMAKVVSDYKNSKAYTDDKRVDGVLKEMFKDSKKNEEENIESDFIKNMRTGRKEFLVTLKKEFAKKGFAVKFAESGDKNMPNLSIIFPFFSDVSFYQLKQWDELKIGYSYFDKITITDGEKYKSSNLKD